MSAALEDTVVEYEDLADIERDFDDAETEIVRQQVALTAPLYAHRSKTVSQIPNFWPLVLEQAPTDIDQYIQPSDSALLLSSLLSLSVSRFELSDTFDGDPRSVSIRWEFSPNDYFNDAVLEKKFWYRKSKRGWSGLVSEPVRIAWKKDKDLTGGLLDLVCDAWEEDQTLKGEGKGKRKSSETMSDKQKALKKKIDTTGMGGLSFFAWFGFIGQRVSKEENEEATKLEQVKREARKRGEKVVVEDDEDEEEDDIGMSLEIFADGDDLAVAIVEDLWPGAIKYFTAAQEQDALSDADFESDDGGEEEQGDASGDEDEAPPAKKQRT